MQKTMKVAFVSRDAAGRAAVTVAQLRLDTVWFCVEEGDDAFVNSVPEIG